MTLPQHAAGHPWQAGDESSGNGVVASCVRPDVRVACRNPADPAHPTSGALQHAETVLSAATAAGRQQGAT